MVPSHDEHENWEPWEHQVQRKNSCSLWIPVERGKREERIRLQSKPATYVKYVTLSLYVLCEDLILSALTFHLKLILSSEVSRNKASVQRLVAIHMHFTLLFWSVCYASDLTVQPGSALLPGFPRLCSHHLCFLFSLQLAGSPLHLFPTPHGPLMSTSSCLAPEH